MRKLIRALGVAAGLVLLSPSAFAAADSCVLDTATPQSSINTSCTCASGTCDAPTATPTVPTSSAAATHAVRLGPTVTAIDVRLCPTTAGANITAAKVDVYFYDAGAWYKFNASVLTGPAGAANQCVGIQGDSPGKGIPMISKRAAWVHVVPNGTTLSAGGVKVEVLASGPSGSL